MTLIPLLTAAGPTFLLRDDFLDTLAAGSVDATPAKPGPGTRTDQTTDAVSISGGELLIDGEVDANGISYDDVAVSGHPAGALAYAKARITTTGTAERGPFGFDSDGLATTRVSAAGFYFHVNTVIAQVGGTGINNAGLSGLSANDLVHTALILRAAGAFYVAWEDGDTPALQWVDDTLSAATLYLTCGARNAAGCTHAYQTIRHAQLAGIWSTAYDIATQRLAGARSAADTFTHEADTLIEFTVTTLPSSGQIEVRFRIQDTSNYWQVTIDASGDLDLDEVVAGSATQRGTSAAAIANGDRIVITANDQTLRVYEANTLDITYTSAANFKTETSGEIESLGTGGAVSDLIAWPRTLSGAALALLQEHTT
jgi:hypothetical protein